MPVEEITIVEGLPDSIVPLVEVFVRDQLDDLVFRREEGRFLLTDLSPFEHQSPEDVRVIGAIRLEPYPDCQSTELAFVTYYPEEWTEPQEEIVRRFLESWDPLLSRLLSLGHFYGLNPTPYPWWSDATGCLAVIEIGTAILRAFRGAISWIFKRKKAQAEQESEIEYVATPPQEPYAPRPETLAEMSLPEGIGEQPMPARESITLGDSADEPSATKDTQTPKQFVFRRRGEVWEIAYDKGEMFFLTDIKGLNYIACLLSRPYKLFDVMELVSAIEKSGPETSTSLYDEESPDAASDGGDDYGILDGTAEAEYRERLREIAEEREWAEQSDDVEKLLKLDDEVAWIQEELKRDIGLGGRKRTFSDSHERARVSVRQAVKGAYDKIAEHDRALFEYLESHIDTGKTCSYHPDPDMPVEWAM